VLVIAAILCISIGLIHSYFGERFILIPLFRETNIPPLLGSDFFTKRTIRFAWHITTIAWWGFGYLLFIIADEKSNIHESVLYTIATVFLISGLLAFMFTKGQHLSWIVFCTISGIAFYVTTII